MKPETRVVHVGRELDASGAVSPPLHLSTTYARNDGGELVGDHLYSRISNPNRRRLETLVADLEGGADARAFASGSAATHALLLVCEADARVVIGKDLYYGVRTLFREDAGRRGLTVVETDFADLSVIDGADLVVFETPTNPMLEVIDIAAVADKCKAAGAVLAVDNTFATPMLQQPLSHGADLVVHSTSKYLAGHSDVIGGALVCKDAETDWWARIIQLQERGGAVPSPFDCWLVLRGASTLALRVAKACENANALADFLETQEAVERVRHPAPGAMISFQLAGGEKAAAAFMSKLKLIVRATSLGGVHSLAEHRRLVEDENSTTPANLIRFSVGIEDVDDLRDDLAQALAQA